ncbi:cora-domain-containing protein [Ascobolus immersus RN42]|uniref:Cora-domain-containing protein n=1 Tax=Ascobolus immersus RN42 TaxID=1160509 RepID=A0A3N4II33_ASCIM|nr:cora-domain-containing protein [Ascobolus immersus RN42]
MDTPRSGSPVTNRPNSAELDDHRHQPHSLPRSNTLQSAQRPDFLFTPGHNRTLSRESNENAVVEDDDYFGMQSPASGGSNLFPRQGRPRAQSGVSMQKPPSSRSPSPPNSVEAFADPRRRRRESMSSLSPSEDDLEMNRTVSRRPTFDAGDGRNSNEDSEANKNAQEDVCFPMPEASPIEGIDFDEMEEFVMELKLQRELRGDSRSFMEENNDRKATSTPVTDASSITRIPTNSSASSVKSEKAKTPKTPVQIPDRYTFFSSEMDTTVHAAEFAGLVCEGESFRDLFRGGESVWWLDCLNPTEGEMRMLMKAFGVHPLTAEDIRVQETREKVELFKNYYFVCFRSFVQDKDAEDFLEPINIYLVVFREGILTFTFRACPHANNVRRRIRQLRDYVSLSSDWICYAMIDDITDSFAPAIERVERESDHIEDAVFIARDNDFSNLLKQIGECRKRCMSLMRLLGMKADVIKGFAKRCNEQYPMTPRREIGLYLGDIQDHVLTMSANITHIEKMLSRSYSNYLAQLSVEVMVTNNRANEVLGKITLLGTILVPLNLICGLFGMNVHVPGQDTENLNWFYGICGMIGFIVVASFCEARRRKLI